MIYMFTKIFSKKSKKDSEFSVFIREGSSREKKKIFIDVLKKANEDQKKILNKKVTIKTI